MLLTHKEFSTIPLAQHYGEDEESDLFFSHAIECVNSLWLGTAGGWGDYSAEHKIRTSKFLIFVLEEQSFFSDKTDVLLCIFSSQCVLWRWNVFWTAVLCGLNTKWEQITGQCVLWRWNVFWTAVLCGLNTKWEQITATDSLPACKTRFHSVWLPYVMILHRWYYTDDITLMILHWWYDTDDVTPMLLHWWYDTDDITLMILHRWYYTDDVTLMILHRWFDTDDNTLMIIHWWYYTDDLTPMIWHWWYDTDDMTPMILHRWYYTDDITLMILHWWFDTDDMTLMTWHRWHDADDMMPMIWRRWYDTDDMTLTNAAFPLGSLYIAFKGYNFINKVLFVLSKIVVVLSWVCIPSFSFHPFTISLINSINQSIGLWWKGRQ